MTRSPLLQMELEQGFTWRRNMRLMSLLPYFDRDLVELVLRIHPEHLIAGGRQKAPLRELVAQRLPSVRMPTRKVDFTQNLHEVLRSDGRSAWERLGGPRRLAELGIVDPDALRDFLGDYFSGRRFPGFRVWHVLSTEMWLRARMS
jgi:hypothetical protein